MTDLILPHYHISNQIGRIVLLAMEEVIGKNGINAVLNQADLRYRINNYPQNTTELGVSFNEISQLQVALQQLYGPRGGCGLALRTGRVCFKYGLRELGYMMGFTDLSFRLMPLDDKIRAGIKVLSEIYNKFSDVRGEIIETDMHYYWQIENCPICWQQKAGSPVCHLMVGMLQEALYWVSGGKFYNIEETNCIAMGDPACIVTIDKHSMD